MKKHIGFVLKNYQYSIPTFSVFDRRDGKFSCVIKNGTGISPGTLISYFVIKKTPRYRITGVEVQDVPLVLARENIVLLHHLLELCFYFLAPRARARKTFDLLLFFYNHADSLTTPLHKKLFLFKLVVSFGFYAGHAPLSVHLFHRLSSESIDSIVSSSLQLKVEKDIDLWIASCIAMHPQAKDFKTVRFLK